MSVDLKKILINQSRHFRYWFTAKFWPLFPLDSMTKADELKSWLAPCGGAASGFNAAQR